MSVGKLSVQCWRCHSKNVIYEEDRLDDVVLHNYHCNGCNTEWYDLADVSAYIFSLRSIVKRSQSQKEPMPQVMERPP